MARMTVTLLGAPRVEQDGVSVEVDTRKAVALVAYLAVTKMPGSGKSEELMSSHGIDAAHIADAVRSLLNR